MICVSKGESLEDWQFAKKVCALTANGGKPIDSLRADFFGTLWVGPYQLFESSQLYVASENHFKLGYLTGCLSTRGFNFKKNFLFHPILFLKVFFGIFSRNTDTQRFVRRFFKLEKSPEGSFGTSFLNQLYQDYPAHLHMNVLSGLRGKGVGRKLFEAYLADLKSAQVKGLHLFCGQDPLAFYQKLGFTILKKIEFKPGIPVYALGMNING